MSPKRPHFRLCRAILLAALSMGSPAMADSDPFHATGYLLAADSPPLAIELLTANGNTIRYREAGKPEDSTPLEASKGSVFECEPPDYTRAMEFYQARSYSQAKALFAAVRKQFAPLESLDDGHAVLAAFYELECLRKTGDLAGLAATLQKFPKGTLSRECQRRQLELCVFWDAVRQKNWQRVDELAKEYAQTRLPGGQRAQVAYCHGLALEGLAKPEGALMQYQTAITADAGASEEVTRLAALRILAIYQRDSGVREALKTPGSPGQFKLDEARAVAALFEKSLGGGMPLPAEFKAFRRPAAKSPG